MKIHRIYAIILRFMYLFRRSYDSWSDTFYWPAIDLLLWGITSKYLQMFAPKASQIVLVIVSGVTFWLIVWRGQHEITISLLEELWNKNLVNIFVTPLKVSEWLMSFIILGIIKVSLSIPFIALLAFILYRVQVFSYGFYFIPFTILLFMTGWWVGFLAAGLILRYGTRVQTFAWVLPTVLMPFSAVYYPVSILPDWAQKVAYLIPTSYVFESARKVLYTGQIDWLPLAISFILNLVYLVIALLFFLKSFQKVLDKGLVKVY
jgi:ABC-2 type transport system permease protein